MGRKAKGWLDKKTGRWFARLGEIDPKTERVAVVMLKDEHGTPIAADDTAGALKAAETLVNVRMERDRMGVTVRDLCKAYIQSRIEEERKPRTIRDAFYHLDRFSRFSHRGVAYADRLAETINPTDVWRFRKSCAGAMRNSYAVIKACWKWGIKPIESRNMRPLIHANLLGDMELPRKGQRNDVLLSWPASLRMLRLARAYARLHAKTRGRRTRSSRWIKVQALVAMAYSGARTSEAVTLEWRDIDWKERVAVIPIDRHKNKRTGRVRRFPILPRFLKVLRVIERWPDRHEKFVFCCKWNKEPSVREWWRWLREDLRPYLARHGLIFPPNWRPYLLRHAFSTTALEEVGADMASTATGNSKDVLLDVYDHVSATRVRTVGDAVQAARKRRSD